MSHKAAVADFVAITGTDDAFAKSFLEVVPPHV